MCKGTSFRSYVIREKLLKSSQKVFKQTIRWSRSIPPQMQSTAFPLSEVLRFLPAQVPLEGSTATWCTLLFPVLYCPWYCEVQSWVSLDTNKQSKLQSKQQKCDSTEIKACMQVSLLPAVSTGTHRQVLKFSFDPSPETFQHLLNYCPFKVSRKIPLFALGLRLSYMSAPCSSQSGQQCTLTTEVHTLQPCFTLPPPIPFPLQQHICMFWSRFLPDPRCSPLALPGCFLLWCPATSCKRDII